MAKKQQRKKGSKQAAAILKKYKSGATLMELKEKFGIKGKSQLAGIILDAQIASGEMPPLSRGKMKSRKTPTEFTVTVNKRGTLVLPKEAVVDAFRAKEGQRYLAKKRGKKIILTMT